MRPWIMNTLSWAHGGEERFLLNWGQISFIDSNMVYFSMRSALAFLQLGRSGTGKHWDPWWGSFQLCDRYKDEYQKLYVRSVSSYVDRCSFEETKQAQHIQWVQISSRFLSRLRSSFKTTWMQSTRRLHGFLQLQHGTQLFPCFGSNKRLHLDFLN